MRRLASIVPLVLATAIAVFFSMLAYGITSEYGATPNGGGMGEALSWTASFAIPSALVVAGLVALGTVGVRKPLRSRLVLAAAALAVLGASSGVLLGSQG